MMYNVSIWIATQLRDFKPETSKGSKTRLYQMVHTTDSVFLIVELAIIRSKMGLET